jgi:hypothetical protein
MNIYAFPALIALLINFTILWAAAKGQQKTKCFIPLVIGFSLLNSCEIVAFRLIGNPEYLEYAIRAYYVAAVSSLSLVCLYSAEVSKFETKFFTYAVASVVATFALVTLFSDMVITGIRSIEYAVTAVKGPAYVLFQIFGVSMLAMIGLLLVLGYRKAETHQQQIKCAGTLVAILPNVLACLTLLVLMGLGFKINAVGIIPLTMIAFILITLASEERHRLTDIRRFIPLSAERSSSNEVMEICTAYARDEISYRDSISKIERVLVVHKYQKNHKNASITAQLMGMPRSSLYSIFNRLKIESKKTESEL